MTTPEALVDELASKRKKTDTSRPLGITEKKEIAKIIDADFALLTGDIKQYAAELTRQRTQEVETEFADRAAETDVYRLRWEEMRTRWRAEYDTFRAACREDNLIIKSEDRYGSNRDILSTSPIAFEIRGRAEALSEIKNEVDHVIKRAMHALEKKRMEAQRNLLMHGGLPQAAQDLLGAMPDPREVLLAAMDNQPRLLALTQQQQRGHVVVGDGEVIEGLVIHDAEDMADRGGRVIEVP